MKIFGSFFLVKISIAYMSQFGPNWQWETTLGQLPPGFFLGNQIGGLKNMTTQEKIIRRKMRLLGLVEYLNKVS